MSRIARAMAAVVMVHRWRVRGWGGAVLVVGLLAMASLAPSAQAAPVPLGEAANFAALAGSTVTNTGPSVISGGHVGVSPGSAVTGFGPGTVTPPSTIHRADSIALQAKTDLTTAYDNVAGRPPGERIFSDLAGRTLEPGVYTATSSLALNGELTLDAKGDPNAEFIFQAGSTLLVGTTTVSAVRLINGAQARNVFWQVGSSATIGVNSVLAGNILALTSISLQTNTELDGRALARNGAVTLETTTITTPADAVLASDTDTTDPEPTYTMGDLDAFKAESANIANQFLQQQPPATPVDPDPASTIDLHPNIARVENAVKSLVPALFAGAYEDAGTVHVGVTGPGIGLAGVIQAAVPNVPLAVFTARHTLSELQATTEAITQLMSNDPSAGIVSAGPDLARNVVAVGVSDTTAPAVVALDATYGDLISIAQEDPIDLTAGVGPGRDTYRNPVLGGLNITDPNFSCSSGFDYGPPIRQDPTGRGGEAGVITAGHCFRRDLISQEWKQGGKFLGTFSRTRFVNGSSADAGTITTKNPVFQFRKVTNAVYVTPGANAFRITNRLARNNGQKDDLVVVSTARSGFHTGSVTAGTFGKSYTFTLDRRIVTIRNVYSANVRNPIVNGDSGGAVFATDRGGVALGIILGSQRGNQKHMFYSQIANVESELGVTVCTGRPSPQC